MSVLNKLTEGIVNRDMKKEGAALLAKWEKTGLLEGLDNDNKRNGMARLLENQAKELLREAASTMAGGDVEGFASVAFPIVRRVFGGLIANDLVSVQPMSLPSGLIFFMDFTFGDSKLDQGDIGSSIYGGDRVASEITGGVLLGSSSATDMNAPGERGPYGLNNGFSLPTGSTAATMLADSEIHGTGAAPGGTVIGGTQDELDRLLRYDPDLSGSIVASVVLEGGTTGDLDQLDVANLTAIATTASLSHGRLVRRLTQFASGSLQNQDPSLASFKLRLVFESKSKTSAGVQAFADEIVNLQTACTLALPLADNFNAADATGGVVGAAKWALEDVTAIPEINIKVDSVAVTAQTRKLKAKWTPHGFLIQD